MTPWDSFFINSIKKIFTGKRRIIDIGGGLRVIKEKNNRYNPSHEWIRPYIEKVDYKIMDPVPDYNPDIVGDIHKMPFEDASIDAIICIAVLEHVEDPIRASKEIYRVLKRGGDAFFFVPFLYYYHAEKGYYGDYWRFTTDSINYMFKDFSKIEMQSVRGALETWIYLTPLGRFTAMNLFFRFLDKMTGKIGSNQVSGYNILLQK